MGERTSSEQGLPTHSVNQKSLNAGEQGELPTKPDIQKLQRDARLKGEIPHLYEHCALDPLYPLVADLAKRRMGRAPKGGTRYSTPQPGVLQGDALSLLPQYDV